MIFGNESTMLLASAIGNLFFLALFSIPLILAKFLKKSSLKKFTLFVFYLSAFYVGYRTSGLDYNAYKDIYNDHITGFFTSTYVMEPLFVFVSYFFKEIGFSYPAFLSFFHIFTAMVLVYWISRLNVKREYYLYFLIVVTVFFGYQDVTRAYFSSVMFFAFLASTIVGRCKIIYLVLSVVMHFSSLIFIPYYLYHKFIYKKINYFFLIVLSCVLGLLVFSYIQATLEGNLDSDIYIYRKLLGYAVNYGYGKDLEDYASFSHLISLNSVVYSVSFLLSIYSLVVIPFVKKEKKLNSVFISSYEFSVLIFVFLMVSGAGILAVRISLLFVFPIIICLHHAFYVSHNFYTKYGLLRKLFWLFNCVFIFLAIFYTGQVYLPSSRFYFGF